jgi:hypothetical protein
MFGFFRRKPKAPPVDDRRTANDWRPGDLAVAIDNGRGWDDICSTEGVKIPVHGAVYRVLSVYEKVNSRNVLAYWLELEGLSPGVGYESNAFRKAQLNHEPAEEAFTRSIRDLVKEPVS